MSLGLPELLRRLPQASESEAQETELAGLSGLMAVLGRSYERPQLLRVALTVGSWVNEHRAAGWPSNACLEFFGDAVLDLVAADTLWRRFPQLQEGPLTRLRASLVSERSLAGAARGIELGRWLFLGKGDEQRGARDRDGTLADALEAILGSAFLDARAAGGDGLVAAATVFEGLFGERLRALEPEDGLDPKSQLQQLVQAEHRLTPIYVNAGAPIDLESPRWRARVELRLASGELRVLGEGEARSLRLAEREAARDALRQRDSAGST